VTVVRENFSEIPSSIAQCVQHTAQCSIAQCVQHTAQCSIAQCVQHTAQCSIAQCVSVFQGLLRG